MIYVFFVLSFFTSRVDSQDPRLTHIAGVYQGKTLFVQNPYNPALGQFCIESIKLNSKELNINMQLSAIKLDFKGIDPFTPVVIEIHHRDSLCRPVILNPDAIDFHSAFSFRQIVMSDSALVWTAAGDHRAGSYILERYQNGIWMKEDTVASHGKFEASRYFYYPKLDEGPCKLRIKYVFPDRSRYLYSREIDFHYYPDPVTFTPYQVEDFLHLSRSASYEIYDGGSNLVLSGTGIEVDVRQLPRGDYVIYFNGSDPGTFRKVQ